MHDWQRQWKLKSKCSKLESECGNTSTNNHCEGASGFAGRASLALVSLVKIRLRLGNGLCSVKIRSQISTLV